MWLLAILLGCNDIQLTKIQDPEPEIVVLPEIIDFGNITSGQETGVEQLTIVNSIMGRYQWGAITKSESQLEMMATCH